MMNELMKSWQYRHNPKIGWTFMWLLHLANDGQVSIGRVKLSELVGVTEREIRTIIHRLQTDGKITVEKRYKASIITICNYSNYNEVSNQNVQESVQENVQESVRILNAINLLLSKGYAVVNLQNVQENVQEDDLKNDHDKKKKNQKEKYILKKEETDKSVSPKESETSVSLSVDTDPPSTPKIEWEGLKNFFNSKMANKAIKPISLITPKRKQAVGARAREYGKEAIMQAIINASQSDFLNGRNSRGWVATFDWMFLPTNFPKVLENNYEDKHGDTAGDYGFNTTRLTNAERQEFEQKQRIQSRIDLIERLKQQNQTPIHNFSDD